MPLVVPDSHRDLLDAETAVLATIGPDGRPQLSAVWFLGDGAELTLSLNARRQKVRNLRVNPAVTLFILDPTRPTRYLEVRGDAELADDVDDAVAGRVEAKYDADLQSFAGEPGPRGVVTIHAARVNAIDLSDD